MSGARVQNRSWATCCEAVHQVLCECLCPQAPAPSITHFDCAACRERKEMIEARNEADTLAYSVEKSLIEYKVGIVPIISMDPS